jgi:hypothetical protein
VSENALNRKIPARFASGFSDSGAVPRNTGQPRAGLGSVGTDRPGSEAKLALLPTYTSEQAIFEPDHIMKPYRISHSSFGLPQDLDLSSEMASYRPNGKSHLKKF